MGVMGSLVILPDAGRLQLGRIAYVAYWQGYGVKPMAWEALAVREQRAWQRAAKAAIAAEKEQACQHN